MGEIRDEVSHLISQIKDDGYRLIKSRYLNHDKNQDENGRGHWQILWEYNSKIENSSYDIFDVQDWDPSKEMVDSFELKFTQL